LHQREQGRKFQTTWEYMEEGPPAKVQSREPSFKEIVSNFIGAGSETTSGKIGGYFVILSGLGERFFGASFAK